MGEIQTHPGVGGTWRWSQKVSCSPGGSRTFHQDGLKHSPWHRLLKYLLCARPCPNHFITNDSLNFHHNQEFKCFHGPHFADEKLEAPRIGVTYLSSQSFKWQRSNLNPARMKGKAMGDVLRLFGEGGLAGCPESHASSPRFIQCLALC